jgi:hypothetical protein
MYWGVCWSRVVAGHAGIGVGIVLGCRNLDLDVGVAGDAIAAL